MALLLGNGLQALRSNVEYEVQFKKAVIIKRALLEIVLFCNLTVSHCVILYLKMQNKQKMLNIIFQN